MYDFFVLMKDKSEELIMNNITKDVLREVINEWDPIDLLSIAPDDEYDPEINEILKTVTGIEVDTEQLANILQKVFIQYFNEELFNKGLCECELIANKILNLSSKLKNTKLN